MAEASVGALADPKGPSCIEGNKAAPERVIEDCDALLMDKATAEPKVPGILLARAGAFARQGRLRMAIEDLDNVIRRVPDSARAYATRAEFYYLSGEYERSLTDFNESIRLDPAQADVFDGRGNAFVAMKQYDRAIADYDEAIKRDGNYWSAYNNRGAAWRLKGDRRRALTDFEAALRVNPSSEMAKASRRLLVREIEQLGAMMPLDNKPSFNCRTAKRPVEKTICGDPGLTQLDREIDQQFRKVLTKLDAKAAAALRKEQGEFVATRNASFGRADYDFRGILEKRLTALRAMANQVQDP